MAKLKVSLYAHQKEAVRFHLQNPYSINAFQMGLGKTLVGITTALIKGHTTLVVCPAFLTHNWRDEINKYSKIPQKITILKDRIKPNGSQFYLVSYDSFMRSMDLWKEIDFLICDEVHYLKNKSAQRTKRIHKYIKDHKPSRFMGLSGTPIKNNIQEFWSILKLCHYGGHYPEFDKYSTDWLWCRDFALKIPNRHSPKGWDWGGLQNPRELKNVIAPVYIRKRTEQVLDLPKQIRKFIRLKDKSKHDKELEKAWKHYAGKNADKESFATAKAVNALSKVKATIELAKELIDEGQKVVVFTDHVQSGKMISEALKCRLIHGQVSMDARHEFVGKFSSKDKAIVGTIGAMSVGLNLTEACHMIFNDYPWVPADMEQAEKRIHRIGQDSTCFYHYMFSSDMDQYIYRALREKKKIVTEATDD